MNEITDFRAIYLPYCIEKQPDGSWLVLNRRYKPVGFNTRDHIDYSQHPVSVQLKGLTQTKLEKLSWTGAADSNRVYLYHDGSSPMLSQQNMKTYLEKLAILAKLAVSGTATPKTLDSGEN